MVLSTWAPGEVFGEAALLADSSMTFTAKALEFTRLLRIDRELLHEAMVLFPSDGEVVLANYLAVRPRLLLQRG